MDRLESMSVLLTAAEAGSLSAAGRKLGMPLATVSRKISELESHLKTRLLNRSTRRLTLTDAGQSYLAACRRILEEIDEAERGASGEYSAPKGELVITAPIAFGRLHIVPIVAEFLRAYPDVDVRLVLRDRVLDLLEDHVDLAVRIGTLPDSGLVATRVGLSRTVTCASPGYFAARGVPKKPGDLAEHDCITFIGLTTSDAWMFLAGRSEIAVPIRSRFTVNTAEAAIDAASAGVGVARVLSYQVAQAVKTGALDIVLEKFEPAPVPISLIHAGQRPLPLKLRAFLDFATPRLRASVPGAAP